MNPTKPSVSPPIPQWTLSSADAVQPSFLIQVSSREPISPYLLGLQELTEKVRRGESAQVSEGLRPLVEAALASAGPPADERAWVKRMADALARR